VIAALLAGVARVISGATVRWSGCAPDTRSRVYFANHTSHFDFLVLWSALPGEVRAVTRPVAAKDYWEAGRLRRYFATRVFRAVLIDRRHLADEDDPVEVMLTAMGDRHSLILFPEGTRGTSGEVGPFRGGLYDLALLRPQAELVPVYIENLNRILPKGEFLPLPLMSSVTFGPVLRVGVGETKAAFLERARGAILSLSTP